MSDPRCPPMASTAVEALLTDPNRLMAEFLTLQEFAVAMDVSERTIQKMVASRRAPPHVRIARKTYFRLSAIKKWLQANENMTTRRGTRRPRQLHGMKGQRDD